MTKTMERDAFRTEQATAEPRCPGCGEDRLIERDHVRRVWVCFVCSKTWR